MYSSSRGTFRIGFAHPQRKIAMAQTKALDAAQPQVERAFGKDSIMWREKRENRARND
jgi:hypothetical protein